ncbi:MAG: hypothetical protein R3B72_18365 [Polyangiaceae bacterium]
MSTISDVFERLRPKSHWTPRYIFERTNVSLWQRLHPEAPWLVSEAVSFLDEWLDRNDLLVEFGSGRSTLWFGERVGEVISLETNPEWHGIVVERARERRLDNVRVLLETSSDPTTFLHRAEEALDGRTPTAIVVDGGFRAESCRWGLGRLASHGILVLDNAERYVPSPSRAPSALPPDAPPEGDDWRHVIDEIDRRRSVRMCNGVWDTLLVFGAKRA